MRLELRCGSNSSPRTSPTAVQALMFRSKGPIRIGKLGFDWGVYTGGGPDGLGGLGRVND